MVETMSDRQNPRVALGLAAVLTMFCCIAQAVAQSADFTLYNDVRSPITGFYTQRPDGSWRNNWLSRPLAMGQHTGMTFSKTPANTACVRNYKITMEDGSGGSDARVHNFCTDLGLHMTADGPAHSAR